MTLALSMIVRNADQTLAACLKSVRGIVDTMYIADTGSTDTSIALAREQGARAISIAWTDDFAEARNRALAEVREDWVLVLDADEILDPAAAGKISSLLQNTSAAGFQVTIRNYVLSLEERLWDRPAKPNDSTLSAAHAYPAYVEHENVRLFRRDPAIYFVGRVHETVGTRILDTGKTLGTADFTIHHFGLAADTETRAQKNRFYRELGLKKIRDMPRNAQAHFELGLVELDNFGNADGALQLFKTACQLNPRLGVAWFFAGAALVRLNRFLEAITSFTEAERRGHRTALVADLRGDAYYNSGRYAEACESYQTALLREPANCSFASKLGLAQVRAGRSEPGLGQLRQAISNNPGNAQLHDRLILALVWLNQLRDAAEAAGHKLDKLPNPPAADFLRAASLFAKCHEWQRAAAAVESGLLVFSNHADLLQAQSEISRSLLSANRVSHVESMP